MFEALSNFYIFLIANFKILLGSLASCYAVERLRLFSLILLGIFLVKMVLHWVVFYRLRRDFPQYDSRDDAKVMEAFRHALAKVRLKRRPRLYRYREQNPLVFTIGTLQPAIFLAPSLTRTLSTEELEAVLVHELTHIKRRDTLFKWLLEGVLVLLPLLTVQAFAFNFVFSGAHSRFAIWGTVTALVLFRGVLWRLLLFLRELSCDDLSVRAQVNPLNLASSLVKVCRLVKALPRRRSRVGLIFAQAFLPSFSKLEFRTRRLIDYRKPRFKLLFSRALRVGALAIAVFVTVFLIRFHSLYGSVQLRVEHSVNCNEHKLVIVKP